MALVRNAIQRLGLVRVHEGERPLRRAMMN